jgi:IMP dehydrogenase/GMP reductase
MRNAIANLRLKFGDDVDIIAGNICTGKAALDLMDWGADAVKVGIGGGCFTPEMQVNTSAGLKNISDVEIGDQVYTHTGVLKSVIDKLTFEKDEDLIEINGIQCTQNHEFYVLHRRYSEKLDDPLFDLNQHAEWISAGNLTVDYLLLERQDTEEISFKAIKIDYIKQFHYIGTVYDLTVQDDHSYNINNIIVHNSVCETRIRTGIGIPQFTAIQQCVEALNTRKNPIPIISDGGIRTPADVCKAIAAGASSVMIGSLFAATAETPGSIKKTGKWPNEQLFKEYRGSASRSSKLDRGEAGKNVEGAETLISYRGKVERIVNDILDGLRSSMSYLGAKNIFEMQANAEFMRITGAGLIEAHPHALIK